MMKGHDIEDDNFEALLQDKRHRELTKKLVELTDAITSKSDESVVDAINSQADNLRLLVKAAQEMPVKNIELTQKEFVTLAHQMYRNIIESNNRVIYALENRLLPDTFDLIKNQMGITQSVKVNYKPANQIT